MEQEINVRKKETFNIAKRLIIQDVNAKSEDVLRTRLLYLIFIFSHT